MAADYVRKGSLIGITGSMDEERWTDRASGEERRRVVVKVDRLELLGSRRDAEPAGGAAPAAGSAGLEEEVPF